MYRVPRNASMTRQAKAYATLRALDTSCFKTSSQTIAARVRPLATIASNIPHCLEVPNLSHAKQVNHVGQVFSELETTGMLKIRLGFPDDNSEYLQQLLLSLHKYHGHKLPISHSATRGGFWDVRPTELDFQAGSHQARSETMDDFPWHTDCSYEDLPPRYFALQVLQHDRFGGGTLSVMNAARLSGLISPQARSALAAPEYQIAVPPEFIKSPERKHIIGNVLIPEDHRLVTSIRFREDILTPLTTRAAQALEELREAISGEARSAVHLRSADLPRGSIILMDNRRWLHARNDIMDPQRHLRRVRWDARRFETGFSSEA